MVGRERPGISGRRFPAPAPLEGLIGDPGALPWLQISLAEAQERALLEAGVRFEDPETHTPSRGWLAIREDAAISAVAINDFLDKVGDTDAALVVGGRSGALSSQIMLSAAGEPLVVWLPGAAPVDSARWSHASPLEIHAEEQLMEVPVPRAQFGADLIELPLTERIVLPCGHWLQLLWANLLGLAPFLWRELAGRNIIEVIWRLSGAVLRTGSIQPLTVGARLGRRGRGCRVHPSAVVEGCWLGDDVQIGANAVVRGCVLGDGAAIEDLALAEFSVLGPGARVQRQGMMKFSLAREAAAVAGTMQLGVLDRGAALKAGAFLMDMALNQDIQVNHRGSRCPVPLGIAGVGVGARTVVGAGVKVAGGRALPPDLQISASSDVVVRIPEDLTGAVTVRDGTLSPR